jgi:hypothetical protein
MTADGDRLEPDGLNPAYSGPTMSVHFNALEARKEGRDIILTFPARQPTEAERETLKRLFPTLTEQAYLLLHKEAVLAHVKE